MGNLLVVFFITYCSEIKILVLEQRNWRHSSEKMGNEFRETVSVFLFTILDWYFRKRRVETLFTTGHLFAKIRKFTWTWLWNAWLRFIYCNSKRCPSSLFTRSLHLWHSLNRLINSFLFFYASRNLFLSSCLHP